MDADGVNVERLVGVEMHIDHVNALYGSEGRGAPVVMRCLRDQVLASFAKSRPGSIRFKWRVLQDSAGRTREITSSVSTCKPGRMRQ